MKTCNVECLDLHFESCDKILSFISIMLILTSPRCILWCPVYWNGWSCFIDGKHFAGKHHALTLPQPFVALLYHQELNVKNYTTPDSSLFSGSSVHIWHDQWTSSWSLPFRHAIPHNKFHSEYFLFFYWNIHMHSCTL